MFRSVDKLPDLSQTSCFSVVAAKVLTKGNTCWFPASNWCRRNVVDNIPRLGFGFQLHNSVDATLLTTLGDFGLVSSFLVAATVLTKLQDLGLVPGCNGVNKIA